MSGLKQFIQDCETNKFYDASECTKSCGKGEKAQKRDVTQKSVAGAKCPVLTRNVSCNQQHCPIDCIQGMWSGWSACSGACGGGTRTRNRATKRPGNFGGTSCDSSEEVEDCNMQACDVPCRLGGWTKWSTCSKYCNGGYQSRFVPVKVKRIGKGYCPSSRSPRRFQSRRCNRQRCPVAGVCSYAEDVMFILDSSGSVRDQGWKLTLKVTQLLAEGFKNQQTRMGAISFSNNARLMRDFTTNRGTFNNAVKSARWQKGGTATHAALSMAAQYFKRSGRSTKKVAVLITDGRPNNDRLAEATARNLRNQRIQLVTVVIGANRHLRNRVRRLVSPPVHQNAVMLVNYRQLRHTSIVRRIMRTACSPNYLR